MIALDLRIGPFLLRFAVELDPGGDEPAEEQDALPEAGPGGSSAALELADTPPFGFASPDATR